MAITEHQRHHLFQRLEEVLGTEEATTLMEHLPPVGWAEVSTKTDLNHHQALTDAAFERSKAELRAEIAGLRTDMERGFREQTRTMVLTNVGTMVAFGSVVLTAASL